MEAVLLVFNLVLSCLFYCLMRTLDAVGPTPTLKNTVSGSLQLEMKTFRQESARTTVSWFLKRTPGS